ncbi:hypothetical protein LMG27174_06375 [Paraburkholderia rhynchosiae]|uniref:Uncharacterized protein n=1 Tax=Paraburkholderia rhynchosiae TaxID=487049 RepID=A0A6J5CLT4_9BURK|nr:hypothetical protein LMG27174_06375 [Paraburkholderia rhynchosiae]
MDNRNVSLATNVHSFQAPQRLDDRHISLATSLVASSVVNCRHGNHSIPLYIDAVPSSFASCKGNESRWKDPLIQHDGSRSFESRPHFLTVKNKRKATFFHRKTCVKVIVPRTSSNQHGKVASTQCDREGMIIFPCPSPPRHASRSCEVEAKSKEFRAPPNHERKSVYGTTMRRRKRGTRISSPFEHTVRAMNASRLQTCALLNSIEFSPGVSVAFSAPSPRIPETSPRESPNRNRVQSRRVYGQHLPTSRYSSDTTANALRQLRPKTIAKEQRPLHSPPLPLRSVASGEIRL